MRGSQWKMTDNLRVARDVEFTNDEHSQHFITSRGALNHHPVQKEKHTGMCHLQTFDESTGMSTFDAITGI